MPNPSDGAVFGAQAGEDWLNPNGIRSTYHDFESFWYLYLRIQHFVVDLHQETKQKQNVMKNITNLEADFLTAILNSENGTGCDPEWNWFGQIKFDSKKGRALASSLKKKDILIVDDTDAEDDFAGTYVCIKDEYLNRNENTGQVLLMNVYVQ